MADEGLNVIAGHLRLAGAKELGLPGVPVIILRGLSEVQKRALRIADNKVALNSGWDLELLKLELAEIVVEMPDIELGFAPGEIDSLLLTKVDPDEEVIPATPATAVSRLGDLFRFGAHAFIVGDCADEGVMQRLMQGKLADAAVQDPPFNRSADSIGNTTFQRR